MLEDVEKLTKIRQTTKIPRAKILAKFEEINKMRSEIQKMDQTTIAEVGFIKITHSLDPLKRSNPGIHGQLGLGSTGPRFSFSGPGPVQSYVRRTRFGPRFLSCPILLRSRFLKVFQSWSGRPLSTSISLVLVLVGPFDRLWSMDPWCKPELSMIFRLKPRKIRSMNEPPSEIKDIMKAVFVLLGEAPSKLETWTGIRALIGKTGPESLRRRICEFNPKSLINQEVTVKHAKSLCKNQS